MHNTRIIFALLFSITFLSSETLLADEGDDVTFAPKKFYFSNDFDGALLTTAFQEQTPGGPGSVGTPRFTYFFHFGFNMNYDFNNLVGLFTGVSIKNIGFIEKSSVVTDSTIKRRVYTAGIPLGLKLGDLKKKNYVFLGGGVDFPVNYREKGFVKRNDKEKFNEWFSDRVPHYMPYGFVGFSFKPGIFIKVQYYPENFMNATFTETVEVSPGVNVTRQPYANYDVKLLMFSIGFDIRYSNKMKIKYNDSDPVM